MNRTTVDPRPGIIYAIIDPRNGRVRYIGKTGTSAQSRWGDHLYRLRTGKHGNSHLQRWFNKLADVPRFKILQECLPGMLDHCEIEWIAKARKRGWPLCNQSDGGGLPSTTKPEVKAKLSAISKAKWQDPEYRKRHQNAMRNAKWPNSSLSPEERFRRAEQHQRNVAIDRRNKQIGSERKRDRESFTTLTLLTHDNRAFVPLTNGLRAVVDAEDAARVAEFVWYANKNGKNYRARRKLTQATIQSLPQFIVPGKRIRHLSNDLLDCRKSNLVAA